MGMLNDIIRKDPPPGFSDGCARKQKDCQLPFPGPWWVLQPDRGNEETRSVDVALLQEPQRFARCGAQSSEAQDPKSHS